MKWLLLYLLVINAAGFLLFFSDKRRAVQNRWRIRESWLMAAALLGGSIGCLAGMYLFRHKTKHKKFTIGIPLILLLEAACAAGLFYWYQTAVPYNRDPVRLVRHELSSLTSLDSGDVDQIVSYQDLFPSEDSDKAIPQSIRELFVDFFKPFGYKILNTEKSGDEAVITVRLTTLDGEAVAAEYTRAALSSQIQNTASPTAVEFSLEDCYLLLGTVLKENTFDTVTSECEISLHRRDGIWEISSSSQLTDAVTNHFAASVSDPYLLTPSETAQVYLDTLKSFDMEQLTRYFSLDSLFSGDAEYKRSISQALSQQLLTYLDYQILEESISEDKTTATVSMELTSCDCYSIMENYQEQVLSYAQTSQALQDGISGRLNKANDILISCIQNNTESATTTLEVNLENDGSGWNLKSDNTFSEALLGNISEAMDEVLQQIS